jgi:hypothetical protein
MIRLSSTIILKGALMPTAHSMKRARRPECNPHCTHTATAWRDSAKFKRLDAHSSVMASSGDIHNSSTGASSGESSRNKCMVEAHQTTRSAGNVGVNHGLLCVFYTHPTGREYALPVGPRFCMSDNGLSGGPPAASPRKSSGLNAKVIHVSPRAAEPATAGAMHEASALEVEELHDEPHGACLVIDRRILLKSALVFSWIPVVSR